MKTRAAVLVRTGQPLDITDLELPALKAGQVLVEVVYTGVCHTQLLEARGHRGDDPYLPHCLGHEGTGIVREIGEGVTKVKPGDRVVLSWIQGSGMQVPGCVYQRDGDKVNSGAITTFGELSVISENRLTVLPEAMPMRTAAMLGCALPTGLGAVINTAGPKPGQSLVVFGAGGVGLCAVAGAVVAGCCPIVAVDVLDEKLQTARTMGATHTINAGQNDPLEALAEIAPGGVDFAIEVTGKPQVMAQALLAVRMRGGAAVVVGNAHHGQALTFDPKQLNLGKRLLGTWGGDCEPDRDFPRFARLLQAGRIDVAPLLSSDYRLDDINQALDDLETGKAIRPIIRMTSSAEA